MDQNEQRSKRNGDVRPENSGKSTQTIKHVKLDLERPKLTKEGNIDQTRKRPRSRKRSFDSSKKDRWLGCHRQEHDRVRMQGRHGAR